MHEWLVHCRPCLQSSVSAVWPRSYSYRLSSISFCSHVPPFAFGFLPLPESFILKCVAAPSSALDFDGYYGFIGKPLWLRSRIPALLGRSVVVVTLPPLQSGFSPGKNNHSIATYPPPPHSSVTERKLGFRNHRYSAPDACLYRGSLSFGRRLWLTLSSDPSLAWRRTFSPSSGSASQVSLGTLGLLPTHSLLSGLRPGFRRPAVAHTGRTAPGNLSLREKFSLRRREALIGVLEDISLDHGRSHAFPHRSRKVGIAPQLTSPQFSS